MPQIAQGLVNQTVGVGQQIREGVERGQETGYRRNLGGLMAAGDVAGARSLAFERGDIETGQTIGQQISAQKAGEQDQTNAQQEMFRTAMGESADALMRASRIEDDEQRGQAIAVITLQMGQLYPQIEEQIMQAGSDLNTITAEDLGRAAQAMGATMPTEGSATMREYQDAQGTNRLGRVVNGRMVQSADDPLAPAPSAGTNVNVNIPENRRYAPPVAFGQEGYPFATDRGVMQLDQSSGQWKEAAGTDVATVEEEEADWTPTQAQTSMMLFDQKDAIITEALEGVIEGAEAGTGWSSLLSFLPGSNALDFKQKVETIVANIGFDELQEMRDSSPTGGALGQVTVREIELLQALRGSLDVAQSPEQFKENAQRILRDLVQVQDDRRRIYHTEYPDQARDMYGPPVLSSQAEYDALPAGATYITPSGETRRKGGGE